MHVFVGSCIRTDNSTSETYVGLTENDFKTRYRYDKSSLRHAHSRNSTKLSKHIWDFKDNNIADTVSWNILSRAKPYNSANKRCNLCLGNFIIICQRENSTLNKRNEPVASCRHRNKALLRYNTQGISLIICFLHVNILFIKVCWWVSVTAQETALYRQCCSNLFS